MAICWVPPCRPWGGLGPGLGHYLLSMAHSNPPEPKSPIGALVRIDGPFERAFDLLLGPLFKTQ